jgi:uncharacterized protein (TIGR03000 family)
MLKQWFPAATLAAALMLTTAATSQAQYSSAGTGYYGGGNYSRYYSYGYPFFYGYGSPYYYGPRSYPPLGPMFGASPAYTNPNYSAGRFNQAPQAVPVTLDVTLPAHAELWIEGKKMTQKGAVRKFVSPPLTPGERYTYELLAKWKEGDKEVTRTQSLDVTPGQEHKVDFVKPDKAPGRIEEFPPRKKKADNPPKGPGRIEEFPPPKQEK